MATVTPNTTTANTQGSLETGIESNIASIAAALGSSATKSDSTPLPPISTTDEVIKSLDTGISTVFGAADTATKLDLNPTIKPTWSTTENGLIVDTYDFNDNIHGLAKTANIVNHGMIVVNKQTIKYKPTQGILSGTAIISGLSTPILGNKQIEGASLYIEHIDGYWESEIQSYFLGIVSGVTKKSGKINDRGINIGKSLNLPPNVGNSGEANKSFANCVAYVAARIPIVSKAITYIASAPAVVLPLQEVKKKIGPLIAKAISGIGAVAAKIAKAINEAVDEINDLTAKILKKIKSIQDLLDLINLKCPPDPKSQAFMKDVLKAQQKIASAYADYQKAKQIYNAIDNMSKNGVTLGGVMNVATMIDPKGVPHLLGLEDLNDADNKELQDGLAGISSLVGSINNANASYQRLEALGSVIENFDKNPIASLKAFDKISDQMIKESDAREAALAKLQSAEDYAKHKETEHQASTAETQKFANSIGLGDLTSPIKIGDKTISPFSEEQDAYLKALKAGKTNLNDSYPVATATDSTSTLANSTLTTTANTNTTTTTTT